MKSVALNASVRAEIRRNAIKSLRTAGRIPAVIYGRQTQPQNLSVDAKELGALIHHGISEIILVDLTVQGDAKARRLALVQEVQHHPLDGRVLHVDFHEVSETEKVTISVPVETVGEAVGVKTGGGVLEHVRFKIKVRALPKDLPEQIILDVTALEIGRSIHIGEVKAPEGVEVLGPKDAVVVSCAAPRTEAEEAPAAEAVVAAGEVEMIKEKKDEGAVAGAPAKAGDKAAPAGDKPGEKKAEKKAEKKK